MARAGGRSPKSKVQSQKSGDTQDVRHARIQHHAASPLNPPPLNPCSILPGKSCPTRSRLPHADVISERLETLVALTQHATRNTPHAPLVVTSVVALLQRTFPAGTVRERTRTLTRGDRADPLDLVEWLEDAGLRAGGASDPERGIALRGGILDIYPLTSPWPVRLEFFGDELESLRQFDPLTQISREEITAVTIPPAGELGLLKECGVRSAECGVKTLNPQPSILNHVWGRCWIICRRKRFFCSASRSNWPSAPTNTPAKFPKATLSSFRGKRSGAGW